MREFQILITDQVNGNELDAHTHPSTILKAGIAGEHKASRLVFCLPESWGSEWTYVVECVNSMGEGTPSEKLSVVEKDGKRTVSFDIPRSMTEMGSGDYVLEAISYDGEEVAKIIRSATVRVGIEKSPTFKKRVVDAIRGIYEELIAKLETIINRFNNGEFNGATFTPSVSAGGDLSWSNDKNLANPETVNIKGEKGDKGDKGDDGKDGSFSDELAEEIAANTAARHTHDNKKFLDGLTEAMFGKLNVCRELPQTASNGDICSYFPVNCFSASDSGCRFFVNGDVLKQICIDYANTSFGIFFYDLNGTETGSVIFNSWGENEIYATFEVRNDNEAWCLQFVDGVFDPENSYFNDTTVTELPESFELPAFSSLESDVPDLKETLFYIPQRLMIYRDGWHEYTSAETANTNVSHGYKLPENAKEGDLFLYAPMNTLTLADSGKRIYFDWEEFRKPVSEEDYTRFFITCLNKNLENNCALQIDCQRNSQGSQLHLYKFKSLEIVDGVPTEVGEIFTFAFDMGELNTEESSGHGDTIGNGSPYNSIDELPLYLDIPEFDEIQDLNVEGNAYLFHTEYKLMKYQGGEWVEFNPLSHTHENYNTLDSFSCNALDNPVTDGDFNFGINTEDWNRLKFRGDTVLFNTDGAVVQKIEEKEIDGQKYLRVTLHKPGLNLGTGGGLPSFFDIPVKAVEEKGDVSLNGAGLGLVLGGGASYDRIELTAESATLEPNTNYSFGESATLTLEFAEGDAAKVNEYTFTFISGETPTVLTLPSSVQWANELTVEANKRYEISIVDNIGLWCAVDYTAEVSE